jgi:dTDP-4-dehydrorhamnose reductase
MKIVVLGTTGMLGHKMLQKLSSNFDSVIGFAYEDVTRSPFDKVTLFRDVEMVTGVNAADFHALGKQLLNIRPDYIVNCIGIIKQRETASAFIPCIELNALLPHKLAAFAQEWGGRVIHFSTDCVFDGSRGGYSEKDFSDAQDLYGKSKFLGEVTGENALTLRTSIIGRELTSHKSLLDWVLSQNRKTIKGFRNVIYSGVTTNQMAEVVKMIIKKFPALSGLNQVVADPISKHDLLCLIREAFKLDIEIIPETETVSNRSMKGDKLREETGYVSPPWPELMANLTNDPTPYKEWGIRLYGE